MNFSRRATDVPAFISSPQQAQREESVRALQTSAQARSGRGRVTNHGA